MSNAAVFLGQGVNTVVVSGSGALSGDGSSGSPLGVAVDGTTIAISADALSALGAAVAFKTIAVAGQSDIVADAAADTLTVAAGTNVVLTTNAGTDTLTIAGTGGATAGPFTLVSSIQVVNGRVTALTGT